ncbi:tryptophan halogenase family protein [Cellvibrio fibrivorans]|uniref:Tryptophan halogenase n=1 Tax=Cellvibrio fibrivorans TaxID=126350 RepID=A0ABU1USZ7_9GAMM|nr:tryptophan 7-halogenase [Cellvibrio fibrivorans]MDR7088304.1 tryptophan halogenase [Cellvibrio fibrivorans]
MMNSLRNLVIVGGGTSGWMTAAALAKFLHPQQYQITLVESDAIGTVGVGEATVPHIRYFNEVLGIDENEFMKKTNATYKLGIEFSNWGKLGDAYIHPFGVYGQSRNDISFHHYWLKLQQLGDAGSISDYSVGVVAAAAEKFAYPASDPRSLFSKYSYAFHIDASLYAGFLRDYSIARGVKRIEGKIDQVNQHPDSGSIQSVQLASGEILAGDLFIDCSGFRGLLINETLKTGFEDWSHWLPCDRAIAVPSAKTREPLPYTKAIARAAGWQWRIPLQSRTGNGQVYSSKYISDDEVANSLLTNLDGEPLANLNYLRFKTGRRVKCWNKNCVAIGLSSGFLEPLESTSIYLIQVAIMKLVEFFPYADMEAANTDEFNRDMANEYERIRDFLILHYHATARDDSAFWNYCRTMEIPQSLAYKMDLFREQGHVERYKRGMFLEPSWVAVYMGQGIFPKTYHPLVNAQEPAQLQQQLHAMRDTIIAGVRAMPGHAESIKRYCHGDTSEKSWPPAAMSLYGVFS